MTHFTLPLIVDGPGTYVTRGGDLVTVEAISTHRSYGYQNRADGHYSNGIRETWSCRGGRVLPYGESCNDIVSKAAAGAPGAPMAR